MLEEETTNGEATEHRVVVAARDVGRLEEWCGLFDSHKVGEEARAALEALLDETTVPEKAFYAAAIPIQRRYRFSNEFCASIQNFLTDVSIRNGRKKVTKRKVKVAELEQPEQEAQKEPEPEQRRPYITKHGIPSYGAWN
jgi:hypothetical protein